MDFGKWPTPFLLKWHYSITFSSLFHRRPFFLERKMGLAASLPKIDGHAVPIDSIRTREYLILASVVMLDGRHLLTSLISLVLYEIVQ